MFSAREQAHGLQTWTSESVLWIGFNLENVGQLGATLGHTHCMCALSYRLGMVDLFVE